MTSNLKPILCAWIALLSIPSAVALTIWENPPVRLPENVREWLNLEMHCNPGEVKARTSQPLRLEHIELHIPSEAIESVGYGLRVEIYNALVFTRNGQKFVRWILNPEDTQFRVQLIDSIKVATGRVPTIHSRFVGYLTASRSVVAHDPVTGAIFSYKASTNQTGGRWHDKFLSKAAGGLARAYSDFIYRHAAIDNLPTFRALVEPLGFFSTTTDQALVIRDYPSFTNGKIRLFPFFCGLHDTLGKTFAEERGEDATSFWRKHISEPWGRAMGEALAHYGFFPESAHDQDFLAERNEQGDFTGRVYSRDLMDSDGDEMIFRARGATEVLAAYKPMNKLKLMHGEMVMFAQPFQGHLRDGNPYPFAPPWLDANKFMSGFFDEFKTRYTALTGVDSFVGPQKLDYYSVTERHDLATDPHFLKWISHLEEVERTTCRGGLTLQRPAAANATALAK